MRRGAEAPVESAGSSEPRSSFSLILKHQRCHHVAALKSVWCCPPRPDSLGTNSPLPQSLMKGTPSTLSHCLSLFSILSLSFCFFLKSLVNKLWQLAKEAFAVHTILANSLWARNDKLYSAVTSAFFFFCLFVSSGDGSSMAYFTKLICVPKPFTSFDGFYVTSTVWCRMLISIIFCAFCFHFSTEGIWSFFIIILVFFLEFI